MREGKIDAACSLIEYMRNVYKILVGKREEKRQLGRGRCRWDSRHCTVLRWSYRRHVRIWTGSIWPGLVLGSSNEPMIL
jgi:hypothetical protein